jgi:hypothetical protein
MFLKRSSRITLAVFLAMACALPAMAIPSSPARSPLPVFPGAEGFGTATPAGRGGQVIKVTNLNDSGSGSLRAAIQARGPRIVVFEVSGYIKLAKDLKINHPFITIAGQTAPSPGISLRGAALRVRTHDVLVQHIRIRVGDDPRGPNPDNRDGFALDATGVYNVVLDHVSASWAIDENANTWYSQHDVTISNCIISEGLSNSLHPKGEHSKGMLIGDKATNVTFIDNLLAHNKERNPLLKGSSSAIVMNNVIYNGGMSYLMYLNDDYASGPILASAVGNVFIDGPNTPSGAKAIYVTNKCQSGTEVYAADNASTDNLFGYDTRFNPRVSSPPIWLSSLTVRLSSTVESWVEAHAGARPADRDAVDTRVVNEVKTRTGHIIDSQKEVGGWPSLATNHRTFNIPPHPNGDDDGDGYSNIEEVLQEMARGVEEANSPAVLPSDH